MTHNDLLNTIKTQPEHVEFDQVINTINQHYTYSPTRFTNGVDGDIVINEVGTNEGSCKIFAFAQLNQLNKEETLACFGHYYRDDVLANPQGSDHGNIRRFMQYGWDGIHFDSQALVSQSSN